MSDPLYIEPTNVNNFDPFSNDFYAPVMLFQAFRTLYNVHGVAWLGESVRQVVESSHLEPSCNVNDAFNLMNDTQRCGQAVDELGIDAVIRGVKLGNYYCNIPIQHKFNHNYGDDSFFGWQNNFTSIRFNILYVFMYKPNTDYQKYRMWGLQGGDLFGLIRSERERTPKSEQYVKFSEQQLFNTATYYYDGEMLGARKPYFLDGVSIIRGR